MTLRTARLLSLVETEERSNMMSPVDDDKYNKRRHQVKGSLFRSFSVIVGFLVLATLGLAAAQHLDHPKAKAILSHPKVLAIHKSFKNAAHHFNGEKFKHRPSKLRGATTKLHPHSSIGKSRGDELKPKATEEQNTVAHGEQNTIVDQKLTAKKEQNTVAHDEQYTIADQIE